jgi:hypothetical protein
MNRRTFFGAFVAAALSMSAGVVVAGPHDADRAHPSQSEDSKKPGKNCKNDASGKTSHRDCIATDAHDGKTPGSNGKASKQKD